ncbi:MULTISPECIES: outer membrane protein assembly factor BamC [Gammaproteobacteria]|uniref:outer membrane protein assembly factor BamC n=1 Tax=Gammaproteobacteria TaxID=1236 RepID=UPI000DCFA754|nr:MULTISPECIES: outer membrane protein assembly factor BamC [Gammaproteobacteria]RTE87038.1 outer membrane protein assembly factor BamC [Aliidiomarina sp. B3213]TCZ93172.1 outer membrane protein assembly factor BamC [Lysobacter sp. N42]
MRASRFLPLFAGLLITACSSQYDRPEGSYNYTEIEEHGELVTPGELEVQEQNNRYTIPAVEGSENAYIGKNVSIRPPRQLLAVAPGSRVEAGSDESILYIDTTEGVSDLRAAVWRHMVQVVEGFDVSFELHPEQNRIVTDRFRMLQHERSKPGLANMISREKIITESEQAFEMIFRVASHGRSGALYVNVIEPQWLIDGEVTPLPMHASRTLERNVLNDVSIAMEQSYRSNREVFAQEQINVTMGSSVDGEPAYVIETDFNSAWVLMPDALNNLGFVVDDLNQSEGVYYTTYEPFEDRAWYHIFAFWKRNEEGPLGLSEGTEVTFVVDDRNDRVYITPKLDDVAITEAQLQAWHPLVVAAFRNE